MVVPWAIKIYINLSGMVPKLSDRSLSDESMLKKRESLCLDQNLEGASK